jgi:hypothetical protein
MKAVSRSFLSNDAGIRHSRERLHCSENIADRAFNLDKDTGTALHLCAQILGRIDRNDLTPIDDDHAVAGLFNLWQDMRRQHDGMTPRQALDQLSYFLNLFGVEANGWLVKNEDWRIVEQRLRDSDSLLITPLSFEIILS